jgi:hypothetical protein
LAMPASDIPCAAPPDGSKNQSASSLRARNTPRKTIEITNSGYPQME